MSKRLPRADKKLIIPGGEKQAPPVDPNVRAILHGSDIERGGDDPTVVLEEVDTTIKHEITATTLADEHQSFTNITREIDKNPDSEDWGDGFMAFPEPAHILRGPDGAISSVVPLSEIPGVELSKEAEEAVAVVADAKPTPVPLNRNDRHKLVSILATRMFKYYAQLPRDYPGFHPFRDGIPDLPEGSPKNLAPQANELYPATDAQIYEWLYKFVGARATVMNKRRFGGGISDLALRIE